MPSQEKSEFERSGSESGASASYANSVYPKEEKTETEVIPEVEPEESLMVEPKDDDKDEDDLTENEYVVERILNHVVDEESGELRYLIKWEGYHKKSDRTWEPEENLESASKMLNEYLASVGGKDLILSDWAEKKALAQSSKKGKKRSLSTAGRATNGHKRGRMNESHPASTSPPAGAANAEFNHQQVAGRKK